MSSQKLSRRGFLSAGAIAALGMPLIIADARQALADPIAAALLSRSQRAKLNFNLDWKFIRGDVSGASRTEFDDTHWSTVSTPHTFNDVDSFRKLISHSHGDVGTYKGLAWYRKTFRIPAEYEGRKLFLEFEGMRQAGDIFLNGKHVGLYENGVTAYGLDITDHVNFGGEDNVIAINVNNQLNYKESATGTPFEWNVNAFNPDYGGINRNVWLHVMGRIYQTLPLYYGLETSGVYIYASHFNIPGKMAEIAVEAEVCNESHGGAVPELSALIVDADGEVCAQFSGESKRITAGGKSILKASGRLSNARFWSTEDPYLYDVYSVLKIAGKVVDVTRITTGFRKTAFRGGAGTGGVYVNEKYVYLKGFAQRATNEWAGLGQAYPEWMHDYNARQIRDSNANYIRWMHISPQRVDADSMARYGIIQICPAGDKERDAFGHQWEQRVDVMRASMIYFRNNPSVLFFEAGNSVITVDQMKEMVDLRKRWDPHGGRVVGYRDNDQTAANAALSSIAEYYEVMIGQASQTNELHGPHDMFRGYSAYRRDRAPLIEAEDFRDECARRYWDVYSPPFYKPKFGPLDTYHHTQESFTLAAVKRYWDYRQNRISDKNPNRSKWSGYASIYFSDSDADGRQDSSEVARVSGKVDAVRLEKEAYFAYRVMQNGRPDLHILGHWSYPAGIGDETIKTIYVIANTDSVELVVNGYSQGECHDHENGYIFSFPNVRFSPGSVKAIGRNQGKVVAQQQLVTAGAPAAIRLTPITGPHGLQADGQDVLLIDCEVVDSSGQRCPTDYGRIDFTCTGPAIWRGGYNSGIIDSTNNLYLNTELGINRVAVRSTLNPGLITVTAHRKGLKSAKVQIASERVGRFRGLSASMPQHLPGPAES